MKKLSVYLAIIVALFAVLYFVDYASDQQINSKLAGAAERLYKTSPDKLTKATRDQLNDENYQAIIIPEELEERLAAKESLIVYMFSPECVFCQQTTPVLNELAEEVGVDYRQLNVYEFQAAWNTYGIDATPTLIYFRDGVEADRIVGAIGSENRNTFKQFLEKYGQAG